MQKNSSRLNEWHSRNSTNADFADYISVIVRHGKLIGCIVASAFIISVIVSFLLPKIYKATARVLPPQESNSGLISLLSDTDNPLSGLAGELLGSPTPATIYVGILKSRGVADALNEKFNLKELYKLKYIEDVYATLEERSTIEISKKDRLISVSVKDRDPQRAADMANAYVDLLDQINRRLNITQGKRKRVFLEERLKEVRTDLETSETELKSFQEKYHLVSIEEQAKAVIEGASEIKSEIILSKIQLQVLKKFSTEKQIEAVKLKAKIEELEKQLDAIERGWGDASEGSDQIFGDSKAELYIPFNSLPELGIKLMRLTRATKIQEKLFELLTAQYEMALIEESRDVETIQILDKAVPPEKKVSPKRRAIVISSTMIALLVSLLIAFLLEFNGYGDSLKSK